MNGGTIPERLRVLVDELGDRLSSEQAMWAAEFLAAGEWGLTLEMLADWLSEGSSPLTQQERESFGALAAEMQVVDRVMGPLALCPERTL